MKYLDQSLLLVLKWYAHGNYFPLVKVKQIQEALESNNSLAILDMSILEDLEFYATEGLKKDDPIRVKTKKKFSDRTIVDHKEVLKLILNQVVNMRSKETASNKTIKEYQDLLAIPQNKRTNEESQKLSNLANKILDLK